jgi:excisionase family DNA binding protein
VPSGVSATPAPAEAVEDGRGLPATTTQCLTCLWITEMKWQKRLETARAIGRIAVPPPQREWLSVTQAANLLGVTPEKIYQACRSGGLQHTRLGANGAIRIHRDWLHGWLAQFVQNSPK